MHNVLYLGRIVALAVLLSYSRICAQEPPPCPGNSGVYFLTDNGWKPLTLLQPLGYGSSRGGRAMLTYSAKATVRYKDLQAPQTLDAKPTFCTAGNADIGRNVTIVRLHPKKDHRELQIGKVGRFTGTSMQYSTKDVVAIDVRVQNERSVIITPRSALTSGQYLIVIPGRPAPSAGYDFGVK